MVTSRSVAALAPAALLALTALLATSCDWLSGDIFPSWLPYVEARADLAAAAEAEIGTLRNLDAVEYVHFVDPANNVDKSKILAYLRGLDGEALVAFEPAGMDIAKVLLRGTDPLVGQIDRNIAATPAGFISGNLAFSMANLEAAPNLITGGMPEGILVARSDPTEYFMLHTWYDDTILEYQLEIRKFNSAFIPITNISRRLDAAGSWMNLTNAEYFEAAGSTAGLFRLLVETDFGTYVFSFADETALLSATPLLEDSSVLQSEQIPMGNNGGWLTADGVVMMNREAETYINLYAYDWTTAEISPTDLLQITGDTEAYQIMSFDPSGSWWYLHDQLTEHLYALRTWW